jgi:copper transport protein
VLDTRFGTVWALRLLAWLTLAALVALFVPLRERFATEPLVPAGRALLGAVASPGSRADAPRTPPSDLPRTGGGDRAPTPLLTAAATAVLGFLCVTPALAGHASTLDPSWALVPADVLHVTAMAVWVGGVASLLLVLPAATRTLEPPERTRLLADAVARFSPIALLAVAALVASGTLQSLLELESLSDLVDTAFGRAILIKVALLLCLLALGAWNRQRARPRLAAQAAAGASPGALGVALRRSLRVELALMVTVLAVAAALVSYSPAPAASGPFSASEDVGPARLELTVDPAQAGRNQIHLYLFDRRSGRQYDRARELRLTATLPDKRIGPLRLPVAKAGPGHYVVRRASIAPAGDWRLDLSLRVSAFDAYERRIEVPIR